MQNKRGYAPRLECQQCHYIPQCINCDVSLTYYQHQRCMACNVCGYKTDIPSTCAGCGSNQLKMIGFGTEKIEDELSIIYPNNKTLRIDQDTIKGKNSFQDIIHQFEEHQADMLIGTQMIAKGLFFQDVVLASVLNADGYLSTPDFRAFEKSYQLFYQLLESIAHQKKEGTLLIQTNLAQHPVFKYLATFDYENFYQDFIKEREIFSYPPYSRLIRLILKDKDKDILEQASNKFGLSLKSIFDKRILGPSFPSQGKIKGFYQMHFLIKLNPKTDSLHTYKKLLIDLINGYVWERKHKKVRLIIDVDPYII